MPKYVSYLRTGSGSDEIEIQIEGTSVDISIRRRWMGSGLERYKLACQQHALSASFGLFVVERIEAAVGEDNPFQALTLDDQEMWVPPVIEYVTVLASPVYIHEQSQLAIMRPLGYATWNDTFELVLMVYDFEAQVEKQPFADIWDAIDKRKFAAWSEEMAAKQAASEAADAETSLENWKRILGGKKD